MRIVSEALLLTICFLSCIINRTLMVSDGYRTTYAWCHEDKNFRSSDKGKKRERSASSAKLDVPAAKMARALGTNNPQVSQINILFGSARSTFCSWGLFLCAILAYAPSCVLLCVISLLRIPLLLFLFVCFDSPFFCFRLSLFSWMSCFLQFISNRALLCAV